MTSYRLAARPIAYCWRQGILPTPRVVPTPNRLLSTTFPKADDDDGPSSTTTKSPPPEPTKPASPTPKSVAKTKGRTKPVKATTKSKSKSKSKSASKEPAATGPRERKPRPLAKPRRKFNRGYWNWGPWGLRHKYMRRGPRAPGFKERKMDPETTTLWWAEKKLMKQGTYPIGSRRRRAAIRTSPNIPFEHLPYQCFQEALDILREDRQEKLLKLDMMNARMQRLRALDPSTQKGGEAMKQKRIDWTQRHIDELIILTDINDPEVKRRAEDNLGDMNKPIYQKLARERWESYRKKILQQRLESFKIVPDVLPKLTMTADVELRFGGSRIDPGMILPTERTEKPPTLKVQVYESGARLVTLAVIDSDVPDPENDSYTSRCHFLACNIPLDPNQTNIFLKYLPDTILPWMPPFAQKGTPYHRLGIYILDQPSGEVPLDKAKLLSVYPEEKRDRFSLKSFRDKFSCSPFGFNIFRTLWDPSTKEVMLRHNIPGSDQEWRRNKSERIKPLRKRRGWEARRQGPKYKHVWKYTKNIRGWTDNKKYRTDKRDKKWK